jgi:hypothetical protein
MTRLTPARLAEIKARAHEVHRGTVLDSPACKLAGTNVPDLIVEVERLQAERDAFAGLAGDMWEWLREAGHDGGYNCPTYLQNESCKGCDLVLRYEEPVSKLVDGGGS